MGSGYCGIGTREKQDMFCDFGGEKDEILYCDQDTGQKGRDDGESDYFCTFRIPERSGKDDHL